MSESDFPNKDSVQGKSYEGVNGIRNSLPEQ